MTVTTRRQVLQRDPLYDFAGALREIRAITGWGSLRLCRVLQIKRSTLWAVEGTRGARPNCDDGDAIRVLLLECRSGDWRGLYGESARQRKPTKLDFGPPSLRQSIEIGRSNWSYVYTLIDPRDGQVFYVGKGRHNRLECHDDEARRNAQTDKCQRIREIWKSGLAVDHRIVALFKSSRAAHLYEVLVAREHGGPHLLKQRPL